MGLIKCFSNPSLEIGDIDSEIYTSNRSITKYQNQKGQGKVKQIVMPNDKGVKTKIYADEYINSKFDKEKQDQKKNDNEYQSNYVMKYNSSTNTLKDIESPKIINFQANGILNQDSKLQKFTPTKMLQLSQGPLKQPDYQQNRLKMFIQNNQSQQSQFKPLKTRNLTKQMDNIQIYETPSQILVLEQFGKSINNLDDDSHHSVTQETFKNDLSCDTNPNTGTNGWPIISNSALKEKLIRNRLTRQQQQDVDDNEFSESQTQELGDDETDERSSQNKQQMKRSIDFSSTKRYQNQQSFHSSVGRGEEIKFIIHNKVKDQEGGSQNSLDENTKIQQSFNKAISKRQLQNETNEGMRPSEQVLQSQEMQTIPTLPNKQPRQSKINMILELNLRLSNLTEIKESLFTQNRFIRSVDIRNNKLTKIPESICFLSNLWKLRIDYNFIKELPQRFGSLSNLEYFSAQQNRLDKLPNSIIFLKQKLSILQLNDNQFNTISDEVGELTQLKSLLLHNNPLGQLPISFCGLKRLTEFSLDWFTYHFRDRQIPKLQKNETGKLIIQEFIKFLQLFKASSSNDCEQSVSFVHYFMYFHKLQQVTEVQTLLFPQKRRKLYHLLASNGNLVLFKEFVNLLETTTYLDLNVTDEDDSTPLILAIKNKRKDFIKYLMKMPLININKGSLKYGYPLHLAIQNQEFKVAQRLMDCDNSNDYSKYLDINIRNHDGNNAMHFLFMNFNSNPAMAKKIADMLIEKDININLKNKSELNPLHLAIIGNQYEALKYALEYNQIIKNNPNADKIFIRKQTFDFNIKGGSQDQNCLHLSVAQSQNGLKCLMMLLESDEILNFQDSDIEGRIPKDICAYNSHVYKMLIQYERKITEEILRKNQNIISIGQYSIDILHYHINKQTACRPSEINRKLNEYTYQKQNQKLRLTKSVDKIQIQQRIRENSKSDYQHNKERIKKMLNLSVEKDKNIKDARVFLSDFKLKDKGNKIEDVLYDTQVNESENFRILSPFKSISINLNDRYKSNITENSQFQKSNHLSRNNREPLNNRINDMSLKKKSIIANINTLQINSNVSSPNASFQATTNQFQTLHSKQNSEMTGAESQSQKQFSNQIIIQDKQSIQELQQYLISNFENNSGLISEQKKQQESTPTEEDEEEANIPEDEDDHVTQDKLERNKSPIKTMNNNQAATVTGIVLVQVQDNSKQMTFVKKIIDEINKFKQINKEAQYQVTNIGNQQDLQENISRLGFHNSALSCRQEQGEGFESLQYIINDESMGIQAPQDELMSPRITQNTQRFFNFSQKFSDVLMKTGSTTFRNQCSTFQNYETLFKMIIKQDPDMKIIMNEMISQPLNFLNQQEVVFLIDIIYYTLQQLTFKDIKDSLQGFNNILDLNFRKNRQVTSKMKDIILFELINSHQIKLYDQKKILEIQMKQLESQKLQHDVYQSIESLVPRNNLYQRTPSFKVLMKKSPSLSNKSIDYDVNPNESPARKFKQFNYGSIHSNLVSSPSQPRGLNFSQNSSSVQKPLMKSQDKQTISIVSDLRNSVKGHRDKLKQIQQPLLNKVLEKKQITSVKDQVIDVFQINKNQIIPINKQAFKTANSDIIQINIDKNFESNYLKNIQGKEQQQKHQVITDQNILIMKFNKSNLKLSRQRDTFEDNKKEDSNQGIKYYSQNQSFENNFNSIGLYSSANKNLNIKNPCKVRQLDFNTDQTHHFQSYHSPIDSLPVSSPNFNEYFKRTSAFNIKAPFLSQLNALENRNYYSNTTDNNQQLITANLPQNLLEEQEEGKLLSPRRKKQKIDKNNNSANLMVNSPQKTGIKAIKSERKASYETHKHAFKTMTKSKQPQIIFTGQYLK